MSGDIYDVSVKRDHSRIYIEEGMEEDTLERPIGSMSEKTDWGYFKHCYGDKAEKPMPWYGEFTMTEFVKFLMEYSDLGYYQLKNKCNAIAKGSKTTLKIFFGSDKFDPMRFGGSVLISDPVLAQAIINTYN